MSCEYVYFIGVDINPERMPVERALVLSMNSMNAAVDHINNLDNDRLVEAMYDPIQNRGIVEDIVTRVLAPSNTKLKKIP